MVQQRTSSTFFALLFALLFAAPAQAAAPLNYLTSSGNKAEPVMWLTWGVMVVSIAVIVIISLLVAGAIWRGRGAETPPPGSQIALASSQGGIRWVWIGVSISSLVLLGSIVWTVAVLADINAPATKPAFTVEITGHQWWWQVRYLSDDPSRVFTTANEIHIPTGVPVRFLLIGGDVIHSFWVPQLSGKTDLIPGQTNVTWLEANTPGTYRGTCTEYCGLEHAHMGIVMIAQTPADFQAWYAHQLQSPAPNANGQVAAGMLNFNAYCGSCHAVRGTDAAGALGPDLSHLMTRTTIAAGELPNTPAELTHFISDPQGVKPGILMQRPELGSRELADIQAYLKTLN